MKHMHAGAFIMVLAGSLIVCCSAGLAQIQIPPELRAGSVKVDYLEPRDPGAGNTKDYANYKRYQAIYDRMKKREVLEEYAAFLSPLRLPVLPHIDPDLLKKVQSITWLAPGDGKW